MFRPSHKRLHQTIAWLLLICIAYLSTGVAVFPQIKRRAAHEGRYPCERRGCGCDSAQKCWDSCCCFNDDEKVAWAKRNHVKVPAEVLARIESSKAAQSPPRRACCAHCQSCSAEPKPAGVPDAEESRDRAPDDGPMYGLIALFQKCNGLALYQAVFANAVCKNPEPVWTPLLVCIAWYRPARFRKPISLQWPPTPPPPQAFV